MFPGLITATNVALGYASSKFISTVPLFETNTDATIPRIIFVSPIKSFASLDDIVSCEYAILDIPINKSKKRISLVFMIIIIIIYILDNFNDV